MLYLLESCVIELERLLSLPLDSKSQLEAWYAEAERVQRELPERYPDLEYPHEVWHYLADADIRARDAGLSPVSGEDYD